MDVLAYVVFTVGAVFFLPVVVMAFFYVQPIDGKFWKTWCMVAAGLSVVAAFVAAVTLFVWSIGVVFK